MALIAAAPNLHAGIALRPITGERVFLGFGAIAHPDAGRTGL